MRSSSSSLDWFAANALALISAIILAVFASGSIGSGVEGSGGSLSVSGGEGRPVDATMEVWRAEQLLGVTAERTGASKGGEALCAGVTGESWIGEDGGVSTSMASSRAQGDEECENSDAFCLHDWIPSATFPMLRDSGVGRTSSASSD